MQTKCRARLAVRNRRGVPLPPAWPWLHSSVRRGLGLVYPTRAGFRLIIIDRPTSDERFSIVSVLAPAIQTRLLPAQMHSFGDHLPCPRCFANVAFYKTLF